MLAAVLLRSTMRDEGSAPQPQDAQEGNTFAPVGEAPHGNNYGRPGMHIPCTRLLPVLSLCSPAHAYNAQLHISRKPDMCAPWIWLQNCDIPSAFQHHANRKTMPCIDLRSRLTFRHSRGSQRRFWEACTCLYRWPAL